LLAGFGRENVRLVAVDAAFGIDPVALEAAIQADLERGAQPCAIVASIGTTTTTAFDPLEPIAEIAARYGLWLHVDAAMAGSAMILPEMRHLWAGIERADSIVMNPHKWLGAAFDCTTYFVRDAEHLVRVMSTNPSYLQTSVDGRVKNYRDWGIPLGRRFRALKLYTLILENGVTGLQSRLRRDLDNARWLEDQVRHMPGWQVLAPVKLQTLCVRFEPDGLTAEALDAFTQAWCARINRSGTAYLTPAVLEGRWMVRVSIGSVHTEREHVARLWDAMQEAVRATQAP
jgi:glutamate/tyrosine decarboxylase-like PLP-dependent enzyme